MLLMRSVRDAEGDAFASEAEALFKEARRRQRRRRARIVGAVLAALGGAVLAGGIADGGRPTGTSRGVPRQVATAEVARSASVGTRASVYVVHVAGPENVVVAGGDGVVATSDGGERWRNITPSTMSPVLFGHIVEIASFGTARIWLEPVGDERMDYVPSTDNGGAKWNVGVLPGGAVLSGSPLSFWTPENGRALGEKMAGATGVYQTDDGGVSWKRMASATAGPFSGPVSFTSASDGWTWNRAGLMYRTEDGGRTASWHADLALAGAGTSAAVATSGTDWYALSGPELFASTNAGRTWQESAIRTPTGDSINAIEYLSPTIGWAEAAGPTIGDFYPTYLLRTTDGGRDWSQADFPAVSQR
jgi:photosystem II stability/assembly factor-like uncharacterized protein